jgi:nucleoid DNA-binding protein
MAHVDCLNWVGEGYSLSAFAAEAEKRGCSRKVSSWPPWLKPGLSRVFLAHRGGHKPVDIGVVFGYFELAGADVVMSPVRAGEALALAGGALEPAPALLDFWEGELSTRLRPERTDGGRPRRRAPDPERNDLSEFILDALLDCERPPVPIPHAFAVSTLQSGLEEERGCGFRPHGKLTEATRRRVDTWWGAESGLYLVDPLARSIDRELCELIKALIKAAVHERGRSLETVKELHRRLLEEAEATARAGSGREGSRRRAGTPSFQEAVGRAAAGGGFAPSVPPELAEHCEARGPLVLFRRPYPVYQHQPRAAFRNYLRIDGDDLLAQIVAHYRGKDDHKIELPLYVDLNRPLKWESTVTLLARHVNLDKTRTATVFEEFVRLLAEELASGQPLRVPALGVFDVRSRAARVARIPGRGQPVTIPARQQIRFRAAAALKRGVS